MTGFVDSRLFSSLCLVFFGLQTLVDICTACYVVCCVYIHVILPPVGQMKYRFYSSSLNPRPREKDSFVDILISGIEV